MCSIHKPLIVKASLTKPLLGESIHKFDPFDALMQNGQKYGVYSPTDTKMLQ